VSIKGQGNRVRCTHANNRVIATGLKQKVSALLRGFGGFGQRKTQAVLIMFHGLISYNFVVG
jgi:hypothetical protein